MNGYGYQCATAPRIKVNASQATGKISDNQATRLETRPRGPSSSQPVTAMTGTTVCTNSLPTAAQLLRSSVWASTAWNTIPVTVIAVSPHSRRTENHSEERSSWMASSSAATPTSRFDWIVKNANVLNSRAAAGWK